MKNLLLIILFSFISIGLKAQCSGVSATGTTKAKVTKVCYDTVVVASSLNTVTADTVSCTKLTVTNLTNGLVKSVSDVLSTAAAGVDYTNPSSLSDSLDNYFKISGDTVTGIISGGTSGVNGLDFNYTGIDIVRLYGGSGILVEDPNDIQLNSTSGTVSLTGTSGIRINTAASAFSLYLDADNIASSDKIFTVPNISGQLQTNNSTATLTNKTWNGAVIGETYGGTGLSSLGSGVATFLGTPSSANLAAAITNETGSGAAVFATSPSFTTPSLGDATGGSLTLTGSLGVGSVPPTGTNLLLSKQITGATNAMGMNSNAAIQSGVTSSAIYYQTTANTAAASFATADVRHFYATQGSIGAGSSITTQAGFVAGSSITGATNNYGFQGVIASGTGRFNLYMSGTANNVLVGNTFFGATTAATAKVHIGAGTTTVSPLKFITGTSLTTAESGAVEYTTDDLFFTIATGTARKRFLFADPTGGLTSGRMPFITTNGRLTDDISITYSTSTGLSTTKDITVPHLIGQSSTPAIAAGTGAGTTPTVSVTGTDLGGYISVTTGTTPSLSATIATITFNVAYTSAPRCITLTPANGNASMLSGVNMVYVDQAAISTTTFTFTSGTTALTSATAYKWFYQIVQ